MNKKINKSKEWLQQQIAIGRSRRDMGKELGVEVGTLTRWAKRLGLRITTPPTRTRRYNVNHHYFDIINTETKAYALGLISTDGCIDKYGWQLKISINKQDADVLDIIQQDMQSECPIGKTKDGRRSLAIYSIDITKGLNKYGIVNNKTFTCPFIELPTKILTLHYIRGAIDGDGSIGTKKRSVRFVTASESFMFGFYNWYLRTYGKRCYVGIEPGINIPKYRFVFGSRDKQFIEDLYKNAHIYMKRKYSNYLKNWISVNKLRK